MFSLLTLFAVVLIHVVMQMRRKDLAEAERKHNFPRVVITASTSTSSDGDSGKGSSSNGGGGGGKGEMGWVDPTMHGQGAVESAAAAKQKQKEEEENEWAREESMCSPLAFDVKGYL